MDFDATQAIALDDLDDETDEETEENERKPVAYLKVYFHKGFPETEFPVYEGDNVIGRTEGICNIHIPNKALSKQHACIEVRGNSHMLYDKGSRNKSRKGSLGSQRLLTPEVRYDLNHNDEMTFADMQCAYLTVEELEKEKSKEVKETVHLRVGNQKTADEEESGSETGSESMFHTKPVDGEQTLMYEVESEPSSDLIKPTQPEACSKVYVADSDDDETDLESGGVGDSQGVKAVGETPSAKIPDKELNETLEQPTLEIQKTLIYEEYTESDGDDTDGARGNSKASRVSMTDQTQAYVAESDEEDADNHSHIFTAATQAYDVAESDNEEGKEIYEEATQAYEEATQAYGNNQTQEKSPAKTKYGSTDDICMAATQAYDAHDGKMDSTLDYNPDSTQAFGEKLITTPTLAADTDTFAVPRTRKKGLNVSFDDQSTVYSSDEGHDTTTSGSQGTAATLDVPISPVKSPLKGTKAVGTPMLKRLVPTGGHTGSSLISGITEIGKKRQSTVLTCSDDNSDATQVYDSTGDDGNDKYVDDVDATQAYEEDEDEVSEAKKDGNETDVTQAYDEIAVSNEGDTDATQLYDDPGQMDSEATQAYASDDVSNKELRLDKQQESDSTQAYESDAVDERSKKQIDDLEATQAYGSDDVDGTNFANKKQQNLDGTQTHESDNKNLNQGSKNQMDIEATQAYGNDEIDHVEQGRKEERDDAEATQVYGDEEVSDDKNSPNSKPEESTGFEGDFEPTQTYGNCADFAKPSVEVKNKKTKQLKKVKKVPVVDDMEPTQAYGDSEENLGNTLGAGDLEPTQAYGNKDLSDGTGDGGDTPEPDDNVPLPAARSTRKSRGSGLPKKNDTEMGLSLPLSGRKATRNAKKDVIDVNEETFDRRRSTRGAKQAKRLSDGSEKKKNEIEIAREDVEEATQLYGAKVEEDEHVPDSYSSGDDENHTAIPLPSKATPKSKKRKPPITVISPVIPQIEPSHRMNANENKEDQDTVDTNTSATKRTRHNLRKTKSDMEELKESEHQTSSAKPSRSSRKGASRPEKEDKKQVEKSGRRSASADSYGSDNIKDKSTTSKASRSSRRKTTGQIRTDLEAGIDDSVEPKTRTSRGRTKKTIEPETEDSEVQKNEVHKSRTRNTRKTENKNQDENLGKTETLEQKPEVSTKKHPKKIDNKSQNDSKANKTDEQIVEKASLTRASRSRHASKVIVEDTSKTKESEDDFAEPQTRPTRSRKASAKTKPEEKQGNLTAKRAASMDSQSSEEEGIAPKRGRLAATPKRSAISEAVGSPTLRKKSGPPKVMFTGVTHDGAEKIIENLGGQIVKSGFECTHLVTDKVRRTVKFLCAVARGVPVVTLDWIDRCKDAHTFIDPVPFTVHDETSQKKFGFSLNLSLSKAANHPILTGYKVHVTKSVQPPPQDMKHIIQCAGGQYLTTMPKKAQPSTVVISVADDQDVCTPALDAGIPVVKNEFLLTGILKQELDIEAYKIFSDDDNKASTSRRRTSTAPAASHTEGKRRRR